MNFDEILPDVGENGKYQQLLLWLVFLPAQLPFGSHGYSQLLMSWTPDHWCRVPELDPLNESVYSHIRFGLARDIRDWTLLHSQCEVNRSIYSQVVAREVTAVWLSNGSLTCQHGHYYNRSLLQDDDTIVTEWDLVCERAWLPTLALVLFGVGEVFSLPLYFFIMHRQGRRFAFFLFLATQCLFGVLTALSLNIACFTVLRLLMGLTVPALVASPSALVQELLGPVVRTRALLLSYLYRSLGSVLLAGSVFLIRDWSHVALASTLPFLAFLSYWWVFPESPKWLLARRRFEEAIRLMRSIAETNGKNLTPDYIISTKRRFQLESSLQGDNGCRPKSEMSAVGDIFRSPNLRKRTIMILVSWMTSTSAFVGLNCYCLEMHGDVCLNFLLSAVTELFGWLLSLVILRFCSRRCSYCVSCALGGVLCITMATRRRGKTASLTLFVSTKLSISTSYFILPLWTAELLPSVVRDVGLTLAEAVSLSCPAFIPLLIYQGRTVQSLPMTLIGILQVIGGLLALALPETRQLNLLKGSSQGEHCDTAWSCRNCARFQSQKIDPRNGILRNRGPHPQSPIFSLLKSPVEVKELEQAVADRQPELENPLDELKVTVL